MARNKLREDIKRIRRKLDSARDEDHETTKKLIEAQNIIEACEAAIKILVDGYDLQGLNPSHDKEIDIAEGLLEAIRKWREGQP